MSDAEPASPALLRGIMLKNLGRFADAEKAFREVLAFDAHDAFALHQLAACQFRLPGRHHDALETIRAAIAVEPREANHFAMEGFILCALERSREALETADRAIGIDPFSGFAFTARTQALLQLEQWALAEASARQALTIDPDNSLAANQFAQTLRLQNKTAENAQHIAGMLARDPEDAFTHANAGWAALQSGRRSEAESHFREALRLNPGFASAREGLMNAFRARSRLYRMYLAYCFWMQRLTAKARWAVILGLYGAYMLVFVLLFQKGQHLAIAITLGILYFILVLWSWIARGVGNFILLFDSLVRQALLRNEKIEAVAVGGGVCIGSVLFGAGFAANLLIPIVAGAGLVAAAFPFSLTFTNNSPAGSRLFGCIGFGTLAAAVLVMVESVHPFLSDIVAVKIFLSCLVCCIASTWLGNLRVLRR